ncbi:MAG: C39 family peptidase, partial [Chloroflexi bacterium]|nr:C39 family peptidase [Chloroflexota bacterium]
RHSKATMRAMRAGLRLIVVALLAWAALPAATDAQPIADTSYRAALVRRGVEPPYRTQLDDSIYARSDCGPAVLGMVLDAYGIDQDTLELRHLTHTYQGTWPAVRVGTALQHIAHAAEDFGLSTYGLYDNGDVFHQWTVDDLASQVSTGHLVIPLVRFGLLPGHENTGVRFGHYILLYAIAGDGFMYQDPAVRPIEEGRARWISRAELDQAMAPVWPPRQALALGG